MTTERLTGVAVRPVDTNGPNFLQPPIAPAHAREAGRLVVVDDGQTIAAALYTDAGCLAAIELDPLYALALAGKLVAAAHRHLVRGALLPRRGQRSSATVAGLRRGDQAIVRLRAEFFADFGITQAADEIAAEGRRYEATRWRSDRQKAPTEIADIKGRLFAEVLHGREHFPRSRRVRGVLRAMNSGAIHCRDFGASEAHDDLDH